MSLNLDDIAQQLLNAARKREQDLKDAEEKLTEREEKLKLKEDKYNQMLEELTGREKELTQDRQRLDEKWLELEDTLEEVDTYHKKRKGEFLKEIEESFDVFRKTTMKAAEVSVRNTPELPTKVMPPPMSVTSRLSRIRTPCQAIANRSNLPPSSPIPSRRQLGKRPTDDRPLDNSKRQKTVSNLYLQTPTTATQPRERSGASLSIVPSSDDLERSEEDQMSPTQSSTQEPADASKISAANRDKLISDPENPPPGQDLFRCQVDRLRKGNYLDLPNDVYDKLLSQIQKWDKKSSYVYDLKHQFPWESKVQAARNCVRLCFQRHSSNWKEIGMACEKCSNVRGLCVVVTAPNEVVLRPGGDITKGPAESLYWITSK